MFRPRSNSQVRFAPRDEYSDELRGRPQQSRPSLDSQYSYDSQSTSRTRSRSRPDYHQHRPSSSLADDPIRASRSRSVREEKKTKDWYHKKTLWTTLATVATVAALVPSTVSAKASRDAAHASGRAARASEKSAQQVTKSARASEVSAMGSIMSARAVTNSSIAQGHMDEYGNAVRKDGYGRTEKLRVRAPVSVDGYARGSHGSRRGW